jgi:NitT/TauT family transport system substrate-binding protein
MRLGTLTGAAVVASLLLPTAVLAQQPLKIRVGWNQSPGHLASVLFLNKDNLKHAGKSYAVETIRFRGSTPQMQAIAAGEIEMAALGSTSIYLLVKKANIDARIVADVIQDREGWWTSPFMVAKDGPIKKVEDLKGKRIGTNAIGSAGDTSMRVVLRRAGLKDADFQSIEVQFGNMPAMLAEGKIDMSIILPQFISKVDQTKFVPLFTNRDAAGEQQTVSMMMRKDFLDKNKAALEDFFEDYVRAQRWFLDPANRDAALKIVIEFTKQPRETLEYALTKNDYYRDPNARPDAKRVQNSVNASVEAGVLPEKFDVAPYVDPSWVDQAMKRLDRK